MRVRVRRRPVPVARTNRPTAALHHEIHDRHKPGLVSVHVPDARAPAKRTLFAQGHVLSASVRRAGRSNVGGHR